MYWFGETISDDVEWTSSDHWTPLAAKKLQMGSLKIDAILDLLGDFSAAWKPNSEAFKQALPQLVQESGFSPEETRKTLSLLPELLKRENLERRLMAEFNRSDVLDGFVRLPQQRSRVRAVPAGVILH